MYKIHLWRFIPEVLDEFNIFNMPYDVRLFFSLFFPKFFTSWIRGLLYLMTACLMGNKGRWLLDNNNNNTNLFKCIHIVIWWLDLLRVLMCATKWCCRRRTTLVPSSCRHMYSHSIQIIITVRYHHEKEVPPLNSNNQLNSLHTLALIMMGSSHHLFSIDS